MSFHVPNKFRVQSGHPLSSEDEIGNNGLFRIVTKSKVFKAIASDGGGWEHVSVSLPDRCPTWEEMSFIKAIFWDDEDCVVQFHPPKSEYVNNHLFCLHLWRPTDRELPQPPSIFVGLK
jgi:hypothetical protein